MLRRARVPFVAGGIGLLALSALLAAQAVERVLYVSVFEASSYTPVPSLDPDGVIVREDGVRREVLRVSPATSPMAIAVLIDNSAAATATISDLRRGLEAFLAAIDGLGPVALVTVADRPTILVDYTTDRKALAGGVGRVFAVPGSGATLLDAVVETSRGIRRREEDRAAIVVVTTEHVEFSTLHYQQVLDPLAEAGATMHAIVFLNPGGSARGDAALNRATVLDRGPDETGGVRIDVLTSMSYEDRLRQLAAILKAQHRVVYARPQTLIPPKRVEVAAAKPGLEARGTPARGQAGTR
jgi:hypothetical protein